MKFQKNGLSPNKMMSAAAYAFGSLVRYVQNRTHKPAKKNTHIVIFIGVKFSPNHLYIGASAIDVIGG